MKKLSETTIASPRSMVLFLKKDFAIELSSGTVYPIFRTLEIAGYIIRLPNKTSCLYTLTVRGKHNIEYFEANLVFFNKVFAKL